MLVEKKGKSRNDIRHLLTQMFEAAIAAAQPAICLPPCLPPKPKGRLIVIGAGKASAAMAQAVEKHWGGNISGLVVTRYGYSVPCQSIEIVEAAHPVPDSEGYKAAQRMMQMVQNLTADDMVLCLISGGGSSLLPLPLPGITLEDKQEINRALLESGASISEMNCVRRHLSAIKGGRLAVACYPAQVVNLLLSDVPSDDPASIASGPTVFDETTCKDALDILARYGINVPPAALEILESGVGETVKKDDPLIPFISSKFIATPQLALEAAAKVASDAGITPYILGDSIEGESRDVAKALSGIAIQVATRNQPFKTPCVLLSGGETTVTLRGQGRGGRNVEFLLASAIALKGQPRIHVLAGDTDGVDGKEEVAGAVIDPTTLARAWDLNANPSDYLNANNAHAFFEILGDNIITGPTLTNVNDFRAFYIE